MNRTGERLLFRRAFKVEQNIEKFLEDVLTAAVQFEQGILYYFDGETELFLKKTEEIRGLEREADTLRRDIKLTLYKELLIPESRGDVLGLLENIDNVIDWIKKVLIHISIEMPVVWPELKQDFLSLTRTSVRCVEELIKASRAFFTEVSAVTDALVKVHVLEHEADELEERIMRKAFSGDFIPEMCLKVHVRYFAERISRIADEAEAVAERLEIYSIKRGL
jgi:uncharacterized protein